MTWTGNGSGAGIDVSHTLGAKAGMVIMKRTDSTSNWMVMHRLNDTDYRLLRLNTTDANIQNTDGTYYTSTSFRAYQFNQDTGVAADNMNVNGATYVAYLFAHNAGGFGLTGTDNVISCGSYTGTGTAGNEISLGYEPQYLLIKNTTNTADWWCVDIMRGMSIASAVSVLRPNTSGSEGFFAAGIYPTATGFGLNSLGTSVNQNGDNYIYIAIRRGPMKVPTSGTSVYNGITRTGTGAATNITGAGFPIDLLIQHERATSNNIWTTDRLRGTLSNLDTQSTAAENTNSFFQFDKQDGFGLVGAAANVSGRTMIDWVFRRAPSVFDVVCYTGTGSARTINHNLGLAPEMMIVRQRDGAANWEVYHKTLSAFGTEPANQSRINLNNQNASTVNNQIWNSTTPTSTVFSVGASSDSNSNGGTFVNYLFATCAGVSKVGSYTGTGTTLQIDCGFTGGARFVLIRRQDNTGDWYVWDTARGIVSGNDPYVLLNSANVEVTSTDYIDTYSAGFELSSTAPAAINASGGSFIFLAIA